MACMQPMIVHSLMIHVLIMIVICFVQFYLFYIFLGPSVSPSENDFLAGHLFPLSKYFNAGKQNVFLMTQETRTFS